ncbi:hypothetical protein H8S23_05125 [Anaerofilum sp. BX8]|uniref:Uncharacterized protein n=1 Tax=Anaerofilum hominis TaxID=2763016 RepID=A0A923I6S8_9FIRM|nr:hypothetical protein [Anaerofilum hominis]MBC5580879.1 hypothetical protein [Anaerofilum hominis]
MIFDEIADIMNKESARSIAQKTGLSKSKVSRLQKGLPFYFDYNTVFALQRRGYEIKLEKMSHEKDTK